MCYSDKEVINMAKTENQKLKLLVLKDYLEQYSDEEHPVSISDILTYLEQQGIPAERKSIYRDIQLLEDYGCDVIRTTGKKAGYCIGSRTFDLPELKLLADAVLSSRFLTERKSRQLLQKLGTLTSRHQAGILRRSMVVSGRVKSMNESVIYNVDDIHQAINANSQITFRYFEWDRNKERVFRGSLRRASPYALCWDDENYYMIAHTEEHGITHFRVDKMTQIRMTGTPRVQTEQTRNLDLSSYGKQVFGMFNGETQTVRMRFDNSLAGVVLDRFGKDILLIPDGENHFIYAAEIRVSPLFYGWVASFGTRVRILSPEPVVRGFENLCREILEQYRT